MRTYSNVRRRGPARRPVLALFVMVLMAALALVETSPALAVAPTVTNVNPASGPLSGGTAVTITGSGFTGATIVTFGGISASFSVTNDTTIAATSPAAFITGQVGVAVSTPGGTNTPGAPGTVFTYLQSPVVTFINPTSGSTAGGNSVQVSGSGFTGATGVTFGGTPGTGLVVSNDGLLTIVTPAHAAGAVPVVVSGPSGSSSGSVQFTYGGVGAVNPTFINPPSGPTTGGTTVQITGSGLTGAYSVTFGGTPGTFVTPSGDTSLTVLTPAHLAGAVSVVVYATGGSSNGALTFTYTGASTVNPTFINPASGPTTGGTPVQITGSGLIGAYQVTFGGVAGTGLVPAGDTSLTVFTPAHLAGAVSVVVYATGGASNGALTFTYTGSSTVNPTYITPSSGTTAGGTFVTIGGSGLTGAYSVSFGGSTGTGLVVNSDSSLTVYTPVHAAGAVSVVVYASGGVSNGALTYTYTGGSGIVNPTYITPSSGTTAGGTLVTITGSGLTGAYSVTFGGVAGTGLVSSSDSTLTVYTPAHVAGAVSVVVYASGGTSNGALTFTYGSVTGVPVVTSLSPTSGTTAGGTTVTVYGAGFTGATSVTFGGVAGTSLYVSSDGQLTIVSPAHIAGTVDVLVNNLYGSSTNTTSDNYTYTTGNAPVVTGVSPASAAPGTTVTITGSGFTGATSVTFGGVAGTSLVVVSDGQITVVTPSYSPGTVDVIVTTPNGASAISASAKFTFNPATSTFTLTLNFRWSLVVWVGQDGIAVTTALRGLETPDNPSTNDVSSYVAVIFRWSGSQQKWEANFPGSNLPGVNDFTTLQRGVAYFIGVTGQVTWTAITG